jgi:c-type cytochrome biogenesis protein CcmF
MLFYLSSLSFNLALLVSITLVLLTKFNKTILVKGMNEFIFFLISISLLSSFYSFITDNFNNSITSSHSHSSLSIFYKVSALWSSHEGSILLWSWIFSFYLFLLTFYTSSIDTKIYNYIVWISNSLLLFFLIFTWFISNPFLLTSLFTLEGVDLNPILQDPFLIIHPPILYFGYVGTVIPFILTIVYLRTGYFNIIVYRLFVYISWFFLTLGILLGSWWAYYELGWGGYWFWDPVENIAFLPWLCLLGIIHSLIDMKKTAVYSKWLFLFSILAFYSSIIGTSFVRSGLLSSVHSFISDPTKGIYFMGFLLFLIIGTMISYYRYYSKLIVYSVVSNVKYVNVTNWLLLLLFIIVSLGTFMPSLYYLLFNKQIFIGIDFYNSIIIPFTLLFLFVMNLSLLDNYRNYKISMYGYIIGVSIILSLGIYYYNLSFIISLYVYLSIVLILNTIYLDYLMGLKLNKTMVLGHIGIGLLCLVIVLNNEFEMTSLNDFNINNKIVLNNYELSFNNLNELEGSNYNSLYSKVLITNDNELLGIATPDIRFYNKQGIINHKSVVLSNYLTDIYLTLANGNDIRISIKSFMPLLWVSGLLIVISGGLAIYLTMSIKDKKI